MTIAAIGSLTGLQQKADATASPLGVTQKGVEATAEQRKVASDFEAIFMRQLLGGMEKAGGFGGASNSSGAMYRSMMVGALADSAAQGGGIGLAELILKAMLPPAAAATPPDAAGSPSEKASVGSQTSETVSQRNGS